MRLVDADGAADRILLLNGDMTGSERRRLLRGPLGDGDGLAARRVLDRLDGPGDALAMMLSIDGQLGLVDDMLHYFDRFSMATSLEVRVPFLDHDVVEYCAKIPGAYKVKGMTTKYVLKRAAQRIGSRLGDRQAEDRILRPGRRPVAASALGECDRPVPASARPCLWRLHRSSRAGAADRRACRATAKRARASPALHPDAGALAVCVPAEGARRRTGRRLG